MPTPKTTRYCADAAALNAIKRDGLGWGHDLECGTFHDHAGPVQPPALPRFLTILRRRA